MKTTAAKVFIRKGSMDWVALKTTSPNPNPVYEKKGHPLQLTFHAPEGTGIEYVKQTFGIDAQVEHLSEENKAIAPVKARKAS